MEEVKDIIVQQKLAIKDGVVSFTEYKDGSVEFEFETDKKVIMNIIGDKKVKFIPVDK